MGRPGELSDETEVARALIYQLLAGLLARPASSELLDQLGGLESDAGTELGQALGALSEAARVTTPTEAVREYNRLFIGVGRGELVPYASFYLTGFLMDRPLIGIRDEMARLGLSRAEQVKEPEDHIAGELEIMAGLITGQFGNADGGQTDARRVFERHLLPWAPLFFRDLERAEGAAFYRPVGTLGRIFMKIEREGFALLGPAHAAPAGSEAA